MFPSLNITSEAYAEIRGSKDYPNIEGTVKFHGVHGGTIVMVNLKGLPSDNQYHGLHIHEGDSCSGTAEEPFKNAGGHYNPQNVSHPNHVGDLPPVLAANGIVFSSFYTNRFYPEDIIGRTIIVHAMPDDFKSQPSGNAGMMVACGEIVEQDERIEFSR